MTFADDITVFVSRRQDIETVKKAVGKYKRTAGAKVNFDKFYYQFFYILSDYSLYLFSYIYIYIYIWTGWGIK